MNSVVLIGCIVSDLEFRVLGSGQQFCKFLIAIDKGLTKEKIMVFKETGRATADFVYIVVWGKQAENCSIYLDKGSLVSVYGSIHSSRYTEASGEVRYKTEVLGSKVEFLEFKEKKEPEEDPFYYGGQFKDFSSDDEPPF